MGLLDFAAPSAKFPTPGTRVGGRVTQDAREAQQRDFDTGAPLYWQVDGTRSTNQTDQPALQLVIEVQTDQRDPDVEDDDGVRSIYAKGDMLRAIREATRSVKVRQIRVGGQLHVEYTGDEPLPKGKRGKPKKLYTATYTPPPAEPDPSGLDRTTHQRSLRTVGRADEPPF